MLFPTFSVTLSIHSFLSGSSIIFSFFTFPVMIRYWLFLLYLIPDLLSLQEFDTFTFSKWLNKTLTGGEHLVCRSIQTKSCKEKPSQMYHTATHYCLTGERRDIHNVIVSILPVPLWKKSQVSAVKNLCNAKPQRTTSEDNRQLNFNTSNNLDRYT